MNKNFSIVQKKEDKNFSLLGLSLAPVWLIWSSILKLAGTEKIQIMITESYPTPESLSEYLNKIIKEDKNLNSEQIRTIKFRRDELNDISDIQDKDFKISRYYGFLTKYIQDSFSSWIFAMLFSGPIYLIYKYIKNKNITEGKINDLVLDYLKRGKVRLRKI